MPTSTNKPVGKNAASGNDGSERGLRGEPPHGRRFDDRRPGPATDLAHGRSESGRRNSVGIAPTIFQEDWWLQAAAGPDLQRVGVDWGGREVASLSFVVEKSLGVRTVKMPPYTRTLGPHLSLPVAQPSQRMSHAYRATKEIVAKLPAHDVFRQIFDPQDETAFPFSLCGFDVAADYTFRVPAGIHPDTLWKSLEGRRRKLIADRDKNLRLETHEDLDRFEKMARREFSNSINTYDYKLIERIFRAAAERGQAAIVAAVDERERDVVNAITVWGSGIAYFWLATRDQELAGRGAKSFIAWHAVKWALEKGLSFDFDSYGSLSGARFVSTFGVPPVVRPVVTSRTPLVALGSAFKATISPYARYFFRGDPDVQRS